MKLFALGALVLSASLLVPATALHAQSPTAPQTTKDQQDQLKQDEKASKAKAKAAHDQRKALHQQDKAEKAAKKAGGPQQ